MKKNYHILSRVILFFSTIYLISGILNLIVIPRSIIIYIFIVNAVLEIIYLFLFKTRSNYEKKSIPAIITYPCIIFCCLSVYFNLFFLKIVSLILFSIIILIKIKDEYLNTNFI